MTVDRKQYPCEHVVPIEQEPRHHLVIENEFVRAFAVEIAPHDRTLCHHHPHDYLLYVVGDGDIVSAARDEESKQLSYRDGDCELLEAGLVHVVENLGDTAFRNVVVELLPGAADLRRGADPIVVAGEANITRRFEDERAAILLLEMKSGSEALICGPVVVAGSPEVDTHQRSNIPRVNDFSGLAWIPEGKRVLLQTPENAARRALVFQLGNVGAPQDEEGQVEL
jgi:quercetin dioxygenase-like cupin family protein